MIRNIVESSLRLRALVVVGAVVVMTIGIMSLNKLPVDVFPEVMPVTVNVQTEALGLSAAEVEQLITVPIEADLLTGTPWVDVMRSESVPGLSSIEMTFKPGTNPMHARQVVQEKLTQAHALPNVSRPPHMLQPMSGTNRIMMVGVSSKTQSLIEMSVLARWTIRPRLMGVPGVANVSIWGQRERQLQVQVDPKRLRDHKVSLIDVIKTAGNALWYSPLSFLEASVAGTGGFIETPNQRLGVRHVLPISVAADLAKVPVEEKSGLKLGDIATVVEDHQPLIGDAMNGGGQGLLLVVEKLPDVNTLEVSKAIDAALVALKPGLGGIEFDSQVYHPANYIRTTISNVGGALMIAVLLLAVLLLGLIYDWRAALVAMVAIPVSLAAAVLVLYWTGTTFNIMVLTGLVVALGVIIDDGIVLAQGVLHRLRQGTGASMMKTVLEVSAETRKPLMFATVIVLMAVVPMLFMAGSPELFVKPMVVSYVMAVLASMLVAATLTPGLCLMLFQKVQIMRRDTPLTAWLKWFDQPSALWARAGLAVALLATVVGAALLPRLNVPTAPEFKEPELMVHWDAVPGTSRAEMTRMLDRASKELRTVPGVRHVGGHVGRAILSDQIVGINSSELWVSLDPKADYKTTVTKVGEIVAGYPGVDADVVTYLRSRFGEALAEVDEPIVVRLYGQRHDVLKTESEKLHEAIAAIPGIVDARIDTEANEPVVEIEVDLEAAKEHGVKPGDVRRSATTLIAGLEVGSLFEEQKVFEVVVLGEPKVRHSLSTIHDLLIDTPEGEVVRLGDVAKVRIAPAPNVIRRENVARTVDVVANVKGRPVSAVAADVSRAISGSSFPLEYRAELVGDFAKQQIGRQRVIWSAIAAAIGILFILQAAFGSWSMAFAVLLTLPVALAGTVIGATLSGQTLSLGAMAGFLTVLGLSVRQCIVLIDRYRDLRRKDGVDFGPELIRRGIRERATPVLITALATAAAVLPFALQAGKPGHEILGPLAWVILGGLMTATLYTLCVVPALYAKFGAHAASKAQELEDLDIAV